MSVAQKDGIEAAEQISYEDLYKRWEQANWSAPTRSTSATTARAGRR